MRDISFHVLDIVMNSIKAQATVIKIYIKEKEDSLLLRIKDNGCGMNQEMLNHVLDPFYTSQKNRRVGLGIPMLYANVMKTKGEFNITSSIQKGTVIEAVFNKNHLDCLPFGNIEETLITLILLNPEMDLIYTYIKGDKRYEFNTKELRQILENVPINETGVLVWIRKDLKKFREVFNG